MPTEPAGFQLASAERQAASTVAVCLEIAGAQYVHPDKGVERTAISKLETHHLIENKRQRGIVEIERNTEQKPVHLPVSVHGRDRTLSQPG